MIRSEGEGGASSERDKQGTLPSSTYTISFQLSKVVRDPQFLTTFESKAICYHYIKTNVCLFMKLYLLDYFNCSGRLPLVNAALLIRVSKLFAEHSEADMFSLSIPPNIKRFYINNYKPLMHIITPNPNPIPSSDGLSEPIAYMAQEYMKNTKLMIWKNYRKALFR